MAMPAPPGMFGLQGSVKVEQKTKNILNKHTFERFNAPKEQIKWYCHEIANALTKIENYKMKREFEYYIAKVFSE